MAHVVGAAAWSAALLAIVPWRPRRIFDREEAKRLFGYGKHMVAVAVLVAISLRADQLGGRPLPRRRARWASTPSLSRCPPFVFQAERRSLAGALPRLREAGARSRAASLCRAAHAAPGSGGVLARRRRHGAGRRAAGRGRRSAPQWSDAAAVLPWMGAWAAITALTQHFGEVYKALGQTRILTWMQAITTVLTVPGLVWVAGQGRWAGRHRRGADRGARRARGARPDRDAPAGRPSTRGRASQRRSRARRHRDHGASRWSARGRVVPAWPAPALLAVLTAIGAVVYVGALASSRSWVARRGSRAAASRDGQACATE